MGYTDIKELPKHIFGELKHFFTIYKSLEGKNTEVNEFGGPIEAVAVIENAWRIIGDNLWKGMNYCERISWKNRLQRDCDGSCSCSA